MKFFVCFLYMRGGITLPAYWGYPSRRDRFFTDPVKAREGITLLGRTSGFKLLPKTRKIMILSTCHNGFLCNLMYKKGELPGAPLTNFNDERGGQNFRPPKKSFDPPPPPVIKICEWSPWERAFS